MSRTIMAIDFSGSTSCSSVYWSRVKEIVEKNKSNVTDYIFWHDFMEKVSYSTVKEMFHRMDGRGGTNPSCLVPFFGEDDNLILITDGEISRCSVLNLNDKMKDVKLKSCDAHIISDDPDVSVVCGFTRNVKSSIKTYSKSKRNVEETVVSLSVEDFNLINNIENLTLEEFIDNYEVLKLLLLNRMVGIIHIDTGLHNKLVELKSKLLNAYIKRSTNSYDFDTLLKANNYDGATKLAKTMMFEYYDKNNINGFSSKFDKLISIVSGNTDFSVNQFNRIVNNMFNTCSKVEEENTEGLLDIVSNSTMECPIMLDDDVPVIPILSGDPILYDLDKKVIDGIIKNPLSMLGNKDIVERIKARISQPIGLFAYCKIATSTSARPPSSTSTRLSLYTGLVLDDEDEEPSYMGTYVGSYSDDDSDLEDNGYPSVARHPITRQPMSGAIPLGLEKEYVKEADSALMHMFTGGKIMGNIDLYYAVLFLILKDVPYMNDYYPMVKSQMIHRMDNHKTSASLSGMATLVGTKVLLKEAIWFVLSSGRLTRDNTQKAIRMHAFILDHLVDLNNLNGYHVSEEDLDYCYTTRKMLTMLHQSKKEPDYKSKIRAMYQGHIIINGTYIFLDCPLNSPYYRSSNPSDPLSSLVPAYPLIYYSENDNIETNMDNMVSETFNTFDTFTSGFITSSDTAFSSYRKDRNLTLALAKVVNPSLSANDVNIDDLKIFDCNFHVITDEWKLQGHLPVTININTCRPVFQISESESWSDSFRKHYKDGKMMSTNRYIGDFVVGHLKYPSIDELVEYIWKRTVGKSSNPDIATLNFNIVEDCRDTLKDYENVFECLKPEQFAERFTKSTIVKERIRLERL